MSRILVLDAYPSAGRVSLAHAGASHAGDLYERMLARLGRRDVDVVPFDDDGFDLPRPLTDYGGVAWTGSSLSAHQDTPAVRAQLDLVRRTFAAGIPAFGSCWALQLACTAAGGRVAPNPLGREFGVARTITLNGAGRAHPMYAHKAAAFDAFTSHEDHVVDLGPHATSLASNTFSPVQAAELVVDGAPFWAVQYHPEFELVDVADLGALRAPQLIAQGYFEDAPAAARYLAEVRALGADPHNRALAYRLGVGPSVLDFEQRTAECRAWLDFVG